MCDGTGWYMLAVERDHPAWGQLQRCPCGAAAAARVTAARAVVADELGALASRTFASFRLDDRPISAAVAVGDQRVSPQVQRTQLRAAVEAAESYAARPRGWLYLYGPYGSGKSHLAAAIGNAVAADGRIVIYRSTPGLLEDLRDRETGAQALRRVVEADMLILDDLGVEKRSEWTDDRFFQIFSERAGRPMVVTSNLDMDDLDASGKVDARIVDRLAAARRVWVLATSYRRELRPDGGKRP